MAIKERMPGVNGLNKCGEKILTNTWQNKRKAAWKMRAFRFNLLRNMPQPNKVTNNGAARPPNPDTTYAIMVSWSPSKGFHVAAE